MTKTSKDGKGQELVLFFRWTYTIWFVILMGVKLRDFEAKKVYEQFLAFLILAG